MEEALQQLVTDSLDLSRRKSVGSAGQITVTMDTRALAPDHRIFFRNLHKFRVSQMNEGVDLTELSDEQWGMVQLDKCHHISTTSTSKDGPQSFRVRICKTCCQEDSHIELGTYVDQESAILVNDTFEILNDRLDRLIVLRVEDKPDLHYLVAKKYDRSKGRDYACILDLIAERVTAIEGKKRKPSVSEMIPAFAKRSGGEAGSTTGSAENGSNTQYSTCSTSSEASDELRTASRLSTTGKSLTVTNSHVSLQSALLGSNSRTNSARKRESGRRISISSAPDEEVASQSGSASTIDDEITVTEDHSDNNSTNAALRELSSVCYQRLLSPSIAATVEGSADLTAGTVITGTSMFNHSGGSGTSELIRSMEKVRTSSNLSSLGSAARHAVDKFNLGSPLSGTSTEACTSPTSNSTAVHNFSSGFNSAVASVERLAAAPFTAEKSITGNDGGSSSGGGGGLSSNTLKRHRSSQEDDHADTADYAISTAPATMTACTAAASHSSSSSSGYERLVVGDGQTPRKRAATFSVSEPYPYYSSYHHQTETNNPMATLTWLASLEDVEVDVARSLYELKAGGSGSGLFDTLTTPADNNKNNSNISGSGVGLFAMHSSYEAYRSAASQGYGYDQGDGDAEGDDTYEGEDGDGEGEGEDDDMGEMDEQDLAQMDMYYRQHAVASSMGMNMCMNMVSGVSGKPYGAYPTTFHHNGQSYQHSMGNPQQNSAGENVGFTRMRSSSMSMIERSEAAWAILGNSGGYRSKMDPLSMALKKYHERGGSANAAAQGFVGIYSPEDRKQRIMRFLEKRKRRMWTKKVKYDVRKNFADSRVRVKGRFVKKQDEDDAATAASPGDKLNISHTSHTSCASNSSYDPDTSYCQEEEGVEEEQQLQQQHGRERERGRETPAAAAARPSTPAAMNIKLRVTKSSSAGTGSGSKRRESKSATDSSGKGEGRTRDSKMDTTKTAEDRGGGETGELKLTFTSRRRRHSSAEESDLAGSSSAPGGSTTSAEQQPPPPTAEHQHDPLASSPSGAVTLKLERANLNSSAKAAPVVH